MTAIYGTLTTVKGVCKNCKTKYSYEVDEEFEQEAENLCNKCFKAELLKSLK